MFGQGKQSPDKSEFQLFNDATVEAAEKIYRQVTDGDLMNIDLTELQSLRNSEPSQFILQIPLNDGKRMELALEKIRVFTNDFKIETSKGSSVQEIDLGVHYRGTVSGIPKSLVTLSVYKNELVGLISDGRHDYELVNVKGDASRYILYKIEDLEQRLKENLFNLKCYMDGSGNNAPNYTEEELFNTNRSSHDCKIIQVYLVADYSYYLVNSSNLTTTSNRLTSVFAQTINSYFAEDIIMLNSGIFIWDSEDTFDESADADEQRDDFRAYYNGAGAGWPGDLAQLISGQAGTGAGGIAYFDGLCTSDSYALTRAGADAPIMPWTSYSRFVKVLTHEIGHNLNSRHTHACVWNGDSTQIDDYGNVFNDGTPNPDAEGDACLSAPYLLSVFPTIMSYFDSNAHGTFPISNGMGTQPGNVMRNYIAGRSCLGNGSDLPPVAICQDVTVQLDSNGNGSTTAAAVDNGSVDTCGGLPTLSLSQTSFNCSNLGANVVTLTVTDTFGNVSMCNATVTVEDKIKPSITCPPDIIIECDDDSTPTNTGTPTAADNCDANPVLSFNDVSNLNGCGSTGTITRTWTATDASGNFITCVQTITVVDTTPPNAICQDITVQLGDNEVVFITADQIDNGSNDACGNVTLGIDISSFSCYFLGDHTVTLTVTDECGNESTCTATVTVEGPDEDCDTVADICDECPGGNDTIDNNSDGLPDCAYYPGFENLIEAWKCGIRKNKVLLCHISPDNPDQRETICVGPRAVADHLAHGDYLGPCDDANCDTERETLASAPHKGVNMEIEVVPNPVNDNTTISISLPQGSYAEVEIYNFIGQRVNQLHSGIIDSPMRQFKWNGASQDGAILPSGIYFIVLKSNGQWITKKVSLQ